MVCNAETGEELSWEKLGWGGTASLSAWQETVVAAIRAFFDEGRPQLLEPTTLIDVRSDTDDGVPAVLVVYDHPYSVKRLGLRVCVDAPPSVDILAIGAGETAAEVLADYICAIAISEPLGTSSYRLVEGNDGVWWWGYGYPAPFH
jgi:hypothetical protein